MADMVGSTDANESVNTINIPSYAILDDGTKYPASPNEPNAQLLRVGNTRAGTAAGYNALYYYWSNMYLLNGSCNSFLATIPTIKIPVRGCRQHHAGLGLFLERLCILGMGSQYTAGLIVNVRPKPPITTTDKGFHHPESNTWLNLGG